MSKFEVAQIAVIMIVSFAIGVVFGPVAQSTFAVGMVVGFAFCALPTILQQRREVEQLKVAIDEALAE